MIRTGPASHPCIIQTASMSVPTFLTFSPAQDFGLGDAEYRLVRNPHSSAKLSVLGEFKPVLISQTKVIV